MDTSPEASVLAHVFVQSLLCPASLEKAAKCYCWTQHRNQAVLSMHGQGCVSMIVLFISFLPFPLLPCPEVLDLLADISTFLANGIIGILIVVVMFLLPCAFGDLSITSGILSHPLSITAAAQLLGELPMAPSFLHQAAGNSVLLTPPFPLSCTVTVLSLCCHSQGCRFLYRCLLILPGCEHLFCFTHGN